MILKSIQQLFTCVCCEPRLPRRNTECTRNHHVIFSHKLKDEICFSVTRGHKSRPHWHTYVLTQRVTAVHMGTERFDMWILPLSTTLSCFI